jgi:hypothetical protein
MVLQDEAPSILMPEHQSFGEAYCLGLQVQVFFRRFIGMLVPNYTALRTRRTESSFIRSRIPIPKSVCLFICIKTQNKNTL